jgi:leucyl-tRNA synthetase
VFIADYVLMGYGTGAIMAVPGQDERDWAFAEAYEIDIIRTVKPPDDFDGKAYTGEDADMTRSIEGASTQGIVVDLDCQEHGFLRRRGPGDPQLGGPAAGGRAGAALECRSRCDAQACA